ncbi:dGTPase [Aureococcus anophagefferens]|nr:dGTPase [Aureococcus anophagefferens]
MASSPPPKRPRTDGAAQHAAKPKVFNDSILKHIELHPACIAVVDTREFQRLRRLKQLGPTEWVFPGATHQRFAHSIGVSYLAGRLELIYGDEADAPRGWTWKGRGAEKRFLFEIVSNHRNGIDVDKLDYFERDSHHCNIPISFDSERLLMHARAIRDENGVMTIAYAEKEVWNVYHLFHTRFNLHKRAYQHRVAHAIQEMLCDALLEADDYFTLDGAGGAAVRLSDAMRDLDAYAQLSDTVFDLIKYEARRDPRLAKAAALIDRVDRRSALENLRTHAYVDKFAINYGMKDKNPVDSVCFYLREDDTEGRRLRRDQVSCMVPNQFVEYYVRLYVRENVPELKRAAKAALLDWERDYLGRSSDSAIAPSPTKAAISRSNSLQKPPRLPAVAQPDLPAAAQGRLRPLPGRGAVNGAKY